MIDRDLAALLNHIPDLVFLKDTNGIFLACNRRLASVFGLSEAEVIGRCDYDLLPAELAAEIRVEDHAVLHSGLARRHTNWVVFADGHRELLETNKSPVFDDDGVLSGIVCGARDMTAVHEAQSARRERQEIYGAVGNLAVDSMALIDAATGELIEFNEAAHRNLGFSRDEFGAMHIGEIDPFVGSDAVRERGASVMLERGPNFRTRFRDRSGALRDVRISASALDLRGRRCISAVWTDITESLHGQRMLEMAKNTLERVARGDALEGTLQYVTEAIETQHPDMLCSILLLDEDGLHLRHGAAPSLPSAFCEAIDGVEIGPAAGSCGTAAFTGEEVYVADIEHDPLWKDYAELALGCGLRACWSVPLLASDRRVLGTFAAYYRMPRMATDEEHSDFVNISQLLSIALERHRESARLSASIEEMRRWYAVTLGRESRVLELKEEVNALLLRLGETPRYGVLDTPPGIADVRARN